MHEHRRPGCSSTGAQRLSAPPGWPTVSTLCRSPDAEAARDCTAQRRASSLRRAASRACPGWPLSGTFDFISLDWDMISKIRARCPVRLDELYTATALQHSLRPSCDHEVFPTKACYEASCMSSWDTNVHFSRGPRSKLCTHCRSTAMGPGPTSWVGPTSPVPGLTAGRPSWRGAGAGTRPDRAHGRTAVDHAGRSDAPRPGDAFPCGKAQRFRSVGGTGRLC